MANKRPMITYQDIRDYTVDQIGEAFTDTSGKTTLASRPFGGSIDAEEIKQLFITAPTIYTAPAIYTALWEIKDFKKESSDIQVVKLVSCLLLRGANVNRDGDESLEYMSTLIPTIERLNAKWSIGSPESIEGCNLYSGTVDKMNINLWLVTYEWSIEAGTIGGILSIDDLPNFEHYRAEQRVSDRESAFDNVNRGE